VLLARLQLLQQQLVDAHRQAQEDPLPAAFVTFRCARYQALYQSMYMTFCICICGSSSKLECLHLLLYVVALPCTDA
jgi:hypothetical protein